MTINVFPRDAHAEGFTTVAYKTDGTGIVTGGQDSMLRIYNALPSQRKAEPKTIDDHSEAVLTIATHKVNFATAGEDGSVLIFRTSNNEFEKFLVRSTVPVRCLSFNSNGTRIAVATDEDVIRVVLVRDISKVVTLYGHTTLVKSVSFSPTSDHLISTDCGGDVKIWDMNHTSGAPHCIKTLSGAVNKCASDADVMNTVAWSPDGAYFCFAGKDHEICVYSSKDWTQKYALEFGHFNDIITMAWSPNGSYICSVSKDRQVLIWDTTKKSTVAKYENTVGVTGVSWHPKENELALTDQNGRLLIWFEPLDLSSMQHPAQRASNDMDDLEKLFEEDGTQASFIKRDSILDDAAEDDDEGDDVEDEEGEDLDDGEDVDMMSDMGDFVIDDDGAGYAEEARRRRRDRQQQQRQGRGSTRVIQRGPQFTIIEQKRFQPGATAFRVMDTANPSVPVEGERRYMAFNMFGVVYTIYQGTHSIVNVEFHDQAHNRNFHFTDYYHYTMASVSQDGAVFAVEGGKPKKKEKPAGEEEEEKDGDDDEKNDEQGSGVTSSVLYYRPLINWANNAEWTVHLPEGENVVSVAINEGSVVAVTSAGYVRMFTISGLQNHIFRLDNVVATAAHGTLVLFVYKGGGSGLNGEQNLEFMLMDTGTQDIVQKGNLPLQKNSQLTWIGFSEASQALMYDSQHVLSILHRQRRPGQSYWVPVFDGKATAKSLERQEKYWPVGMLRDRLMCLVVRGNNESPYFPRPPVDDMELRMPVVDLETEAGQLEESHMRMRLISMHDQGEAEATHMEQEYQELLREADQEMDKTLLRLIQIGCRADKEQRILDLAFALHLERSVDAAIKIVTHFKMTGTAEKLIQIKEEKFMSSQDMVFSKRSMDLDMDESMESSKRVRY
ncbi:WD40-repeat-containing domain protein [Zychaea mexicana]|uniref:WD40-repeat-containing domain protein n=1 Tax=Zychaea mexicana TaxID=64656 RepID=UPI0022FF2CDC|nr:WD40-repeat-containing domain protein [Zychaea mexicana]KAI9495678.1 WD40-repeat-containing domain protein [Zychaea mexicana]